MTLTTVNPALLDTQAQYTGFKNRIINGAMVIDQRNAGASVTPAASAYTLDRWQAVLGQASKFSVQQNAAAVTPPAGFINYLGVTSLSAYTVGASEVFLIQQKIEGLNSSDLAWGTASAASITLSFWVRSSLTGTFGGSLQNSAQNRSYPFTYTISVANTWEQKSVTIAGDTSGTWLTTSGVGIYLVFTLAAGSTFSGTAGAWAAADYRGATGATSVVGTNGATFYITGVQLEKGSTATSFDYRPYGTELALCQRYYYGIGGDTANQWAGTGQCFSTTAFNGIAVSFAATMRASPTFSYSALGDWRVQNSSGSGVVLTALTQDALEVSTKSGNLRGTVASGLSAGNATILYAQSTSARLIWSSEL